MGELWFVGAGLGDELDLSLRARTALARCERVYAEEYTSLLAPGSLERLGTEIGRPVERLDRTAVESGTPILEALSAHPRVALLTAGDPFVATTHLALRLRVEEAGHTWQYLPNASVLTAAPGLLGLQSYRFGRTVSLPLPEPAFAPTSPIDRIRANREAGLHTLVLLDLRPSEGRYLEAREALGILAERDPHGHATGPASPVGVVARLGRPSARAWYGPRDRLREVEFGPPLHALVVPAEPLHFQEEAAVARWRLPDGPRAPS